MSLANFFNTYFLTPIIADEGYNLVNTATYAVIALVLLFAIYKIFARLKVSIDFRFFVSLIPFVVLGSSLRAFVDHEIFPYGFWFVSPGIYLLTAGVFLAVFFSAFAVEKFAKVKLWKTAFASGVLIDAVLWLYALFHGLSFTNIIYGAAMTGLALSISALLYVIFKKIPKLGFTDRTSFLPFPAHIFDASTTFVAVDFLGFVEKHPVPTLFTGIVGTAAVMYLLKLAVLIPAVYIIKKEIKDKQAANFLLIAIAVLGLAEGLRNFLTALIV